MSYTAKRKTPVQARSAPTSVRPDAPPRRLRNDPTPASQREKNLLAFKPTGVREDIDAVAGTVFELARAVDTRHDDRDRILMGAGYKYALWHLNTYGEFTAASLTEPRISQFRRQCLGHVSASSESTYVAALRTLARGHNLPLGRSRPRALKPYTTQEWDALTRAASQIELSTDAKTIMALSGGVGMRGSEVAAARGSWVDHHRGETTVTIPDKRGVIRVVPVFGAEATWLCQRAEEVGPSTWLLRPSFTNRPNVSNQVTTKIARQTAVFRRYSISRARHRWIVALLSSPIPFDVVAALAGFNRGSNLAVDLLDYMPEPSDHEIRRAIESALSLHGGTQ